MTKTMKRLMILALLTVVSVGLKAQETNGEEPQVTTEEPAQVPVLYSTFSGGEVETKAIDGQKVTIAVTPSEGFYIGKDDIEVIAVKDPASATRGEESIPISSALELTLVDEDGNPVVDADGKPVADPADLTVARYYQFTVPEGLGAWVCKAEFHEVNKPVTSGKLNDDVSWEVTGDETSKTLTLSGEGVASVASKGGMPWDEFSSDITNLVIEDGVQELGDGLLDGFKALTTITLQGKKYLPLGNNKLPEEVTVDVYGRLYNEYKASDDWGKATIASTGSVEMKGVAFGSGNDYDVFVSSKPLLVPSVLLAFTVTAIDGSNVKISEIDDGIIPANVAVLLLSKDTDDDDFRTVVTNDAGTTKDAGLLKVAGEGGQKVALGEVYLLYNDVFYLSQAGTIPEGGVYLVMPAKKDENMRTRSFLTLGDDEGDGTTAIGNLTPALSKGEGGWYDLSGRRLSAKPTAKGVYIMNGKKIVIK